MNFVLKSGKTFIHYVFIGKELVISESKVVLQNLRKCIFLQKIPYFFTRFKTMKIYKTIQNNYVFVTKLTKFKRFIKLQ